MCAFWLFHLHYNVGLGLPYSYYLLRTLILATLVRSLQKYTLTFFKIHLIHNVLDMQADYSGKCPATEDI